MFSDPLESNSGLPSRNGDETGRLEVVVRVLRFRGIKGNMHQGESLAQ